MANYTVTTTNVQESVLTRVVADYNARQGTSLSTAQYMQLKFDSLMLQKSSSDREQRWNALSTADRDTALAAVE